MHLKNILLIGCTAIVFISCGSNDQKETTVNENNKDTIAQTGDSEEKPVVHGETERPLTNAQKLEGGWVVVRATGAAANTNTGTTYIFTGDKLTLAKDGFSNPGKTEISENTFSFQADGNTYKFMYDYSFNGDTLVVSMQNSNGQTLYLLKQ
jgi:hypothetical protein